MAINYEPTIQTHTVASIFTKHIAKVIPLAFDESMSYYECICAFRDYLNTVIIPNVNNVNDAVAELQSLYLDLQDAVNQEIDRFETEMNTNFNNLHDFVDNYFENNFPALVSSTLDEMAEDGTLENLLNDAAHLIKVYNTYSEMIADSENFTDGLKLQTLGYYNVGDGGNAIYKVITEDSELVIKLVSDVNNVLCHGVSLTDANNNNHTIIKNVLSTYKYAYCNKDIILKNTIDIDISDCKFDFQKITYTGNSYAILMNNDYIEINGKELISSGDGIRCGLSNNTLFCNVKLNYLNATNKGLILGGSNGVAYNSFEINSIKYEVNGVYFDLSSEYVGEIYLKNISFTDTSDSSITEQYAIYMDTSTHRCTGLNLDNISFENCKGGIEIYSTGYMCEHIFANNLRVAELSIRDNKKVLKITGAQTVSPLVGYMTFDYAKPSSFDFTNYACNFNSTFKLQGSFRYEQGQARDVIAVEGYIGYKCLLLTKLPIVYFAQNTGDSVQIPKAENIYVGYSSGQDTIKLKFGDEHYRYNGTIRVLSYDSNITKLQLYANNGTTLVKEIAMQQNRLVEISVGNNQWGTSGQLFYSISDSAEFKDIPSI